jgi:hypothetical protein
MKLMLNCSFYNPRQGEIMRNLLVLVAVAGLAACTTAPKADTAAQIQPLPARPVQMTIAPVNSVQNTLDQVPDWFVDVPKEAGVIHSVGDGVSGSISGALGNARANAFEGICQSAGGTVRSQTKIYRQDTETSSTSLSTTAIRNLCPDVDVTGATVEKRKVIQDGSRFRAFVLVSLPMGDKNTLARQKQADRVSERAAGGAAKEFKELDDLTEKNKAPATDAAPQSRVEGIKLLDVDNADYKAKRDAALQKPGAVIGQTTLQAQ